MQEPKKKLLTQKKKLIFSQTNEVKCANWQAK